jgi:hypothetical protein
LRGDRAEIRLHASSVTAGGSLGYDLVNTRSRSRLATAQTASKTALIPGDFAPAHTG